MVPTYIDSSPFCEVTIVYVFIAVLASFNHIYVLKIVTNYLFIDLYMNLHLQFQTSIV